MSLLIASHIAKLWANHQNFEQYLEHTRLETKELPERKIGQNKSKLDWFLALSVSQHLSLRALQTGKTLQPSRSNILQDLHILTRKGPLSCIVANCRHFERILHAHYCKISYCKILQNATKNKELFMQECASLVYSCKLVSTGSGIQ